MNNKWSFSIISWIITALIIVMVLLPIYTQLGDNYRFYFENIMFIIIFITFTRFIFLTKHHWFSHVTWFKAIAIFAVIPILFYCVDNMWDFQRFLDEEGIGSIMSGVYGDKQVAFGKYIKAQMVFFGASAFITSFLLPFRMLHSIWRLRHRGKV